MSSKPVSAGPAQPETQCGGHILVDALLAHGAELAFGVPGESYLAVLDGFHRRRDQMRFVICRQEGGATVMAEAYGKLTGRPGLAFCTRGPGATNASIGVHTAFQDSTPMILFIGQVGTDFADREAFQEIDYRRMFGQMAKWVAQIDRVERIPEYIARAYQTATSGRPGPVVLALPEDMLTQEAAVPQLAAYQRVLSWPGDADIERLSGMLAAAERPFVLVGGSGWTPQACAQIQQFAERFALPVAARFAARTCSTTGIRTTRRCRYRHQPRAGRAYPPRGPGAGDRPATRRDDHGRLCADQCATAGATAHPCPRGRGGTGQRLPGGPDDPRFDAGHRRASCGVAIAGNAAALAGLDAGRARRLRTLPDAARVHRAGRRHGRGGAHARPPAASRRRRDQRRGNYAGWLHRYFRYRPFAAGGRGQLAPTSGAMGYGVPAAVGAKIAFPQRTVVALAGDGCFLMNGQELATAMQYGAPVVFIVVNNGMYGTIRMHQEREYPAHVLGTELHNPDFAALARAYGARGAIVTTTEAFEPALREALAAPVSTLIEIRVDPDVITPRTTLSAIRAQAQASGKR